MSLNNFLTATFFKANSQFRITTEFNEVAEGDLGGETCKVSEPLNSCYICRSETETEG